MAVRASPPGLGTHSTSRMMRPWASVGARGDEHELGAPGGFAVAFEVECRRRVRARRAKISPVVVSRRVSPGWARKRGVMTLPSAWSMRDEVGVGPRAGPVGVEESELAGLVGGELAVTSRERGEDVGIGEVAVAGVEVVVAAHRLRRAATASARSGTGARIVLADRVPDERVGEFGFDLAGAAVDAEQRLEEEPHELGVVAGPTTGRVRSASGISSASS